jgi:hypothetical protein
VNICRSRGQVYFKLKLTLLTRKIKHDIDSTSTLLNKHYCYEDKSYGNRLKKTACGNEAQDCWLKFEFSETVRIRIKTALRTIRELVRSTGPEWSNIWPDPKRELTNERNGPSNECEPLLQTMCSGASVRYSIDTSLLEGADLPNANLYGTTIDTIRTTRALDCQIVVSGPRTDSGTTPGTHPGTHPGTRPGTDARNDLRNMTNLINKVSSTPMTRRESWLSSKAKLNSILSFLLIGWTLDTAAQSSLHMAYISFYYHSLLCHLWNLK